MPQRCNCGFAGNLKVLTFCKVIILRTSWYTYLNRSNIKRLVYCRYRYSKVYNVSSVSQPWMPELFPHSQKESAGGKARAGGVRARRTSGVWTSGRYIAVVSGIWHLFGKRARIFVAGERGRSSGTQGRVGPSSEKTKVPYRQYTNLIAGLLCLRSTLRLFYLQTEWTWYQLKIVTRTTQKTKARTLE